jgi:hypothetical protein
MSEKAVIMLVIILVSAAATTVAVRVILNVRNKNNSRKTVQKGNIVGGDQAGGDIHKRP